MHHVKDRDVKDALAVELAELNKSGEGGFFGIGVQADLMDSKTTKWPT